MKCDSSPQSPVVSASLTPSDACHCIWWCEACMQMLSHGNPWSSRRTVFVQILTVEMWSSSSMEQQSVGDFHTPYASALSDSALWLYGIFCFVAELLLFLNTTISNTVDRAMSSWDEISQNFTEFISRIPLGILHQLSSISIIKYFIKYTINSPLMVFHLYNCISFCYQLLSLHHLCY